MPKLVFLAGPGPLPFHLYEGRTIVGRDPSADIILDHPEVSRRHCVIERDGERLRILDDSTYGTTLHGRRLPRGAWHPLVHHDELLIGPYQGVLEIKRRQGPVEPTARFGEDPAEGPLGPLALLVGDSKPMREVRRQLRKFADHRASVFVVGESGTGKELAARALHELGPRARAPFVAHNCARVELFESELFGHERGAFTGASDRREGAFLAAQGGTLFLDELGELPLEQQAKLLRALEERQIRRVGATICERVDVRVVAATNQDLVQMVAQGTFRSDLYHRLAVLLLAMPPLRKRRVDLPYLVLVLLARDHLGYRVSQGALNVLEEHDWPGNVRELANVLTRAVVEAGPQRVIEAEHVILDPAGVRRRTRRQRASELDHETIVRALEQAKSVRKAAQRLGVAESSLRHRMRALGIAWCRETHKVLA